MALFKSSLIFSFFQDYNEEVEKLRREVQRYRMELSNRDNNFNRMFTDGQQLMVDPRAGKIAITQQQVLAAGPTQSKSEPVLGNREKSFSYAFVQSLDESVSTEGSRVAVTFVVKHVYMYQLYTACKTLAVVGYALTAPLHISFHIMFTKNIFKISLFL